jgi:S-adenosylmethionine synthetase
MGPRFLFKIADRISDSILDAILARARRPQAA